MNIKQLDLKNKVVLLRVDFNVPLDADRNITDDTRMIKSMPTIQYLLEQNVKLVVMSHLDRPLKKLNDDGSINVAKYTLQNLEKHLADLSGAKVTFCPTHDVEDMQKGVQSISSGEIMFLENTRFHKGEEKGDEGFAKDLASLADVYINDAFGTAHREHSSTATVAKFFDQDHKAFGFLMDAEIVSADKLLYHSVSPVTAIVGGAKVSDKIQLIDKLIDVADNLVIGGGMSYTFVKAMGGKIGTSICEDDYLELALKLLAKAKANNTVIHLPEDVKVADSFSPTAATSYEATNNITDDWQGLDIGPEAIKKYEQIVLDSKTILWNGPMGVFEFTPFSEGTKAVGKAVEQNPNLTIVGGGDSVDAIKRFAFDETKFSHISTGGGAMLEFLEGKMLPGLSTLKVQAEL